MFKNMILVMIWLWSHPSHAGEQMETQKTWRFGKRTKLIDGFCPTHLSSWIISPRDKDTQIQIQKYRTSKVCNSTNLNLPIFLLFWKLFQHSEPFKKLKSRRFWIVADVQLTNECMSVKHEIHESLGVWIKKHWGLQVQPQPSFKLIGGFSY